VIVTYLNFFMEFCFHCNSLEADESLSDSDTEPPSKRGRHKITDPIKNNKKLENTGNLLGNVNGSFV